MPAETSLTPCKLRILLAEDSQSDIFLVRHALESRGFPHELDIVRDGSEALRTVTNLGEVDQVSLPDLLLLDLNLPQVHGAQILKKFREHPACKETPVIIISSSDELSDRAKVESFGVSHYFKKPATYAAFLELGVIVERILRVKGSF